MIQDQSAGEQQPFSDRRKFSRKMTELFAVARNGLDVQSGAIADVSLGGMRLKEISNIEPGTPLIVQLIGGETYIGVVAWSRGEEVGIEFHKPLDPTDEIFGPHRTLILPQNKTTN